MSDPSPTAAKPAATAAALPPLDPPGTRLGSWGLRVGPNAEFSVAGTIFYAKDKLMGIEDAEVRIVDSVGAKRTARTNCVGNFFIGKKNNYGVTGIAARAFPRAAATYTTDFGFSVARAITLAANALRRGDVIIIEQQAPVCGGACGSNQVGSGPVEY